MSVTSISYVDAAQTIVKTVYDSGLESFGPYPAQNGPTIAAHEKFLADGGSVTPYSSPSVTPDQVAAERNRRLALGFSYDFGDARGVHQIGTTEADLAGWDEVTKWSNAAIATGSPNATIDVLTNTGAATVTATEWQQILLAATAARQPLWAASFILQAQNPIPSNYKDDTHWS